MDWRLCFVWIAPSRDFPDQPDLVPALEPESVLRKSLCRDDFHRAGAALGARPCRAIRDHQSQRKTERRIAGPSANGAQPLEKRSQSTPRISARSTIPFAKAFDPCAGLVFERRGRRREVAVS